MAASSQWRRFARTSERADSMIHGTRIKPEIAGTEGKWEYKMCQTNVGSTVTGEKRCDLCNAPMRFTHTVFLPREIRRIPSACYNNIFVGVDCAARLIVPEDATIPRLAENETARKERWRRDVFGVPGTCKTTVDNLIEKGKL
jgi:hypothetical protein